MATIEVRVGGRGRVRDGVATEDGAVSGTCDLCGQDAGTVVSVSAAADDTFACKDCLRRRLEATTVAEWELRDPSERGLPWGKFSG